MGQPEPNQRISLCRIELFGGLRVKIGDTQVHVPRERKAADLLAYLAYYPHIKHPRERLQDILWPESMSNEQLNLAISKLGKCLEPDGSVRHGIYLYSDRSVITLHADRVATDVAEFEAQLKSAQDTAEPDQQTRFMEAAIDLYQGELLPEFYDEWTDQERRRWEEAYSRTLRALVRRHTKGKRCEQALDYARRLVNVDPMDEQIHQYVLLLQAATAGTRAALRYAGDLKQQYSRDGLALSSQTRDIIKQIERQDETVSGAEPELNELTQLLEASPANPAGLVRSRQLEPTGGAVPLDSEFYLARPTDDEFRQAIARRDSIVLVKGPRQTGKTSLLARGLHHARTLDAHIVYTDFNLFSESVFESHGAFMDALADAVRDQLDLPSSANEYAPLADPNSRLERFLRRDVLKALDHPLVWGMDGVDRLFRLPYGESVFALMRSWHESRSLLPDGPWRQLTLAISICTEPYLYIRNMNQSPFNVGTRLEIDDFTMQEVATLNRQYDSPLRSDSELKEFHELLGGHPFLSHQGLHEMRRAGTTMMELSKRADDTAWIFGAHLRALFGLLEQDKEMAATVAQVFAGNPCPSRDSFDRLRSAGVLRGASTEDARPRCTLYARYLQPRFKEWVNTTRP